MIQRSRSLHLENTRAEWSVNLSCETGFGTRSLIFGYCRDCVVRINMAEEDRKGLLEGTQPYSSQPIPNNEYNEALFQEKGKSPKEVRVNYAF